MKLNTTLDEIFASKFAILVVGHSAEEAPSSVFGPVIESLGVFLQTISARSHARGLLFHRRQAQAPQPGP